MSEREKPSMAETATLQSLLARVQALEAVAHPPVEVATADEHDALTERVACLEIAAQEAGWIDCGWLPPPPADRG